MSGSQWAGCRLNCPCKACRARKSWTKPTRSVSQREGLKTWAQEIDKGTSHFPHLSSYEKYKSNMGTQTDTMEFELPSVAMAQPPMPQYSGDEFPGAELRDAPAPHPPISAHRPSSTGGGAGASVPFSNNYYQRMSVSVDPYAYTRQLQSPNKMYHSAEGPPTFRSGRLGASWRHVRQCTGNLGNHICFIDGVVKNDDMKRYPPYGYMPANNNSMSMPPPFLAERKRQALAGTNGASGANKFQDHAKKGFKYWYEEKVPMAERVLPKRTIQGRLMRLGVGY